MREILFRAKRLSDGEWVDGSLFVDAKKDKHEILVGYVNYRVGWEVDPKTVGQFTGLTDKNGTKIFEGDIIQLHGRDLPHWYKEGQNVVVKYNNGGFEPMCEYDSDCGDYIESNECEVIGNIYYDNPELLEG